MTVFVVLTYCDMMNEQGGMEAARKLRGGGYANLVVGVTGNVLNDDVEQFLAAGADMIMGKPVRIALLLMLLTYVREHGALSRPDMQLSEEKERGGDSHLNWKLK